MSEDLSRIAVETRMELELTLEIVRKIKEGLYEVYNSENRYDLDPLMSKFTSICDILDQRMPVLKKLRHQEAIDIENELRLHELRTKKVLETKDILDIYKKGKSLPPGEFRQFLAELKNKIFRVERVATIVIATPHCLFFKHFPYPVMIEEKNLKFCAHMAHELGDNHIEVKDLLLLLSYLEKYHTTFDDTYENIIRSYGNTLPEGIEEFMHWKKGIRGILDQFGQGRIILFYENHKAQIITGRDDEETWLHLEGMPAKIELDERKIKDALILKDTLKEKKITHGAVLHYLNLFTNLQLHPADLKILTNKKVKYGKRWYKILLVDEKGEQIVDGHDNNGFIQLEYQRESGSNLYNKSERISIQDQNILAEVNKEAQKAESGSGRLKEKGPDFVASYLVARIKKIIKQSDQPVQEVISSLYQRRIYGKVYIDGAIIDNDYMLVHLRHMPVSVWIPVKKENLEFALQLDDTRDCENRLRKWAISDNPDIIGWIKEAIHKRIGDWNKHSLNALDNEELRSQFGIKKSDKDMLKAIVEERLIHIPRELAIQKLRESYELMLRPSRNDYKQ